MSAIDRVMRAYRSKYDLNQEQSAVIRGEISAFIDELMSGKRPKSTGVPAKQADAFPSRLDPSVVKESLLEPRKVKSSATAGDVHGATWTT